MKMTVLVDASNIAMASHHANATLASPNGTPTGAVFATLNSISALIERFIPAEGAQANIMFAWDCPRHQSWRRSFYPGYKANRDVPQDPKQAELMEKFYLQIPLLKQMITHLGMDQISAAELEADDLAGTMARLRRAGAIRGSLLLVSSDKDWLQLIDDGTSVWQNTKARLVSLVNFEEVTGVKTPEEFRTMLGIIGDKGDDVPGCPGIGEVNARKFMQGVLKAGSKNHDKIKAWIADPDGLRRSLLLTDLISPVIKQPPVEVVEGKLDPAAFVEMAGELGFNSITGKFPEFLEKYRRLNQ